jgi:hypothetical protein
MGHPMGDDMAEELNGVDLFMDLVEELKRILMLTFLSF